jgi:serine/threonine-protein kinase
MTRRSCPACGQALPADQRFCGRCGTGVDVAAGAAATVTSIPDRTAAPGAYGEPEAEMRFAAGTVVAGRYRVVGLLGRGGMGEVYRADDLKLGRPVALKFLPGSVERDPRRLSRLLNEVRTALSVSHPNVCRVHDIQQEAGRHFITMEFVDGDDLSALLRRIGRLPQDKALQIARQLCAGLGAAHAAGVLHRDLKPANIMLDGRGQVKITDFGLAGSIGGFDEEEVRSGTPAYMSPEQLAGEEVSEASDIYALGLVLYEVYTGKPAFEGATAAELARRRGSAPTNPSTHITDIDPAVERAILRCLERNPADRPTSALAVSAALPGGDPLAAALAAGETPAPELVAEAGAIGGLKPRVAGTLLAAFLVLVGFNIVGNRRLIPAARADLPRSGEILQDRAREILRSLGCDDSPRDSIYSFEYNGDYVRHLDAERTAVSRDALDRSQPSLIHFGYRQSSEWITYESMGAVMEWIERSPPDTPGDVRIRLDPTGRLVWLDAVPPETLPAAAGESAARPTDWEALIAAAGFDPSELTDVAPRWWPRRAFEERRAWEGVYPDARDVPVRVEAASLNGRPVAFRIVEPWTEPLVETPVPLSGPGSGTELGSILGSVLWVVTLSGVCLLAWRNMRLGRGDRRTALRFALALAALRMVWYVASHHYASDEEIGKLTGNLAWAMYRFGLAYAFYLAFEPYARKLWPRVLTSWVRLFDNRFTDPLVGRDLLVGVTLAVVAVGWQFGTAQLLVRFDLPLPRLDTNEWALEALRGLPGAVMGWAGSLTQAMFPFFMVVMVSLFLRLVLRRDWLVLIALILIGTAFGLGDLPLPIALGVSVVTVTVMWVALFRFGLLTFAAVMLVPELFRLPLTFDVGAWWATATWVALIPLLALAVWSFRNALAGQPVFRDGLIKS